MQPPSCQGAGAWSAAALGSGCQPDSLSTHGCQNPSRSLRQYAPALIEARLLQRLFDVCAGHAAGWGQAAVGVQFGEHQARGGPGLMGAAPLDPGQLPGVGAQRRRGVKVRAFHQQLALTLGSDGHQAVLVGLFFDGQHLAVGPLQVTVSALARGQCLGCCASQGLAVELLVGLVDEEQRLITQARCAPPPYS